jgi:hypothetical protein
MMGIYSTIFVHCNIFVAAQYFCRLAALTTWPDFGVQTRWLVDVRAIGFY